MRLQLVCCCGSLDHDVDSLHAESPHVGSHQHSDCGANCHGHAHSKLKGTCSFFERDCVVGNDRFATRLDLNETSHRIHLDTLGFTGVVPEVESFTLFATFISGQRCEITPGYDLHECRRPCEWDDIAIGASNHKLLMLARLRI